MAVRFPSVMVTAASTPMMAGQGKSESPTVRTAGPSLEGDPAKADQKNRTARANPAALGPTERNAVNGVGAPSYTSGHHMCQGTLAIL